MPPRGDARTEDIRTAVWRRSHLPCPSVSGCAPPPGGERWPACLDGESSAKFVAVMGVVVAVPYALL